MSRGPRWQTLATEIEDEIRSGQREPGSRLPSINEQDGHGYSQTTTMRAYRELVSKGLAVAVHGSGTFVADPLPPATESPSLQNHERRIRALEERLAALDDRP
jgi:DNA-binding GntR family transcriptional regulator